VQVDQNIDDQTHSYWQSYVDAMKDELGLKDWVVELQRTAPHDDSKIASIGVFYGQRRARMYIDFPTFMAQTPWTRKVTIVHELLHCHVDHLDEFVRDFCNANEEGTAHQFFYTRYCRESEALVETMSQVVGAWMPDFELSLGDPPTNSMGY